MKNREKSYIFKKVQKFSIASHVTLPESIFLSFFVPPNCGHPTACLFVFFKAHFRSQLVGWDLLGDFRSALFAEAKVVVELPAEPPEIFADLFVTEPSERIRNELPNVDSNKSSE